MTLPACPFCGGEDIRTLTCHWSYLTHRPIPRCMSCGAEAPSVEAWQRRTPPPATRAYLDWMRAGKHLWAVRTTFLLNAFIVEWPEPAKEES